MKYETEPTSIVRHETESDIETTYCLVSLDISDIDPLMDIQQQAWENVPDPDMLRIKTRELTAKCLEPGLSFGAVSEGKIIACVLSNSPRGGGYSSGKYVGFSQEEQNAVINFELGITTHKFKRQGLMDTVKKYSIQRLKELANYKHLIGTISPKNSNLRSVFRIGGIVIGIRMLYDRVLRYISYYPLIGTTTLLDNSEIEILSDEFDQQEIAFRKGYAIVDTKNTEVKKFMVFKKLLSLTNK